MTDTNKRIPLQINLARVERLARKHTCFGGFGPMLDAKGGLRPSINVGGTGPAARERRALADAYDATQAANGDARRAYRY